MVRFYLLALSILSACDGDTKPGIPIVEEDIVEDSIIDADGDGYLSNEDCNDNSIVIHPGAPEICDGIDNNCNDEVDEGVQSTYYFDADQDDFGDPSFTEMGCRPSDGYVAIGTDCNDQDGAVFPGAQEVCDEVDNDCNGEIDEDLGDLWYPDFDQDGYGDLNAEVKACTSPEGYIDRGGDCDDTLAEVFPGATEECDDVDNNCNGEIDEAGSLLWYEDLDQDGFGNPIVFVASCFEREGYVENNLDCNDEDLEIHPDAIEACDQIDNNCNGILDEDAIDGVTWYIDEDQDGYGDSSQSVESCTQPIGYANNSDDCNDSLFSISPAAVEFCNGIDDDCDGIPDDEDVVDRTIFFTDADGDGYGDPDAPIQACSLDVGMVDNNRDCDDSNANVNPGAEEICNGEDDNCNLVVDDGVDGLQLYYEDGDGDGYGTNSSVRNACEQPEGFVSANGDCDDQNAAIHPEAEEICNDTDDDCDGGVDEGFEDSAWYQDSDGDGFGTSSSVSYFCVQPEGYVDRKGDCNDSEPLINPDATEICNGADDDCDGGVDEGFDISAWYTDSDGDGFGNPSSVLETCEEPSGMVQDNSDCDDENADVNPDAVEICNDTDDDCDGGVDEGFEDFAWYQDSDGDGFGTSSSVSYFCVQPEGYVDRKGDCNDSDSAINPDAIEVCNLQDDDCDGGVDEGFTISAWYVDADGDGYGLNSSVVYDCEQREGYSSASGDCNDEDSTVNPTAEEVCNLQDDNCDGRIDEGFITSPWYVDADGDGFGANTSVLYDCEQPEGYAAVNGDCSDDNAAINPNAAEVCNGADDDCDGGVDESFEISAWYNDADGDGFGDPSSVLETCQEPPGMVQDSSDCNDAAPLINPEAIEICNDTDDNCDGDVDEGFQDSAWYQDGDGDGYGTNSSLSYACEQPEGYVSSGGDCADDNTAINPNATEVCNLQDDDCDGNVDEGFTISAWYLDADGDGYGLSASVVYDCEQPEGYAAAKGDCNDDDALINPGAEEVCNLQDDNCDGSIDEGFTTSPWYVDADGDGFGANTTIVYDCEQPEGYAAVNGDCSDDNAAINPNAAEVCNDVDDNCDGRIDEGFSISAWYTDADQDGFGDPSSVLESCEEPPGMVQNSSDCNDSDSTVNPDAIEICNDLDDDCDGGVDEGFEDSAWYQDGDGDGYGTNSSLSYACEQPEGYVSSGGDCNDADASINPAAAEVCNLQDDDCDGGVDEGFENAAWYLDADGDGYGLNGSVNYNCEQPEGYASVGGDCNDGDSGINPAATEVCNLQDDDCDGSIDEDFSTSPWFVDADGDGFGSNGTVLYDCEQPEGYTSTNGDCNDTDPAVNPNAAEVCNDLDDDCDGGVDEGFENSAWYLDADGDGFGLNNAVSYDCQQPEGYTSTNGDCNDADASINPAAEEVCNLQDDDCDGGIDEEFSSSAWYLDADGDGFGLNNSITYDCEQPEGYAADNGDCNDEDETINPSATEVCNLQDDNCDGTIDEGFSAEPWFIDQDSDGFGANTTIAYDCEQPEGYASVSGDCDDQNVMINPNATEVCNLQDDDCDGGVDEGFSISAWYVDADGDGYGLKNSVSYDCEQPEGYAAVKGDCNDADAAINPSATEICNLQDDDCDGGIDEGFSTSPWFVDADGDGFGANSTVSYDCEQPEGYVAANGDCDDSNTAINPDATEVCNGDDDDCDGGIDEGIAVSVWYRDNDGDAFGNPGIVEYNCNQPQGYVLDDSDCDDDDPTTNPNSPEVCNGEDDDCDGGIDEQIPTQVWYIDNDGDGFGNAVLETYNCLQPNNYVSNSADCDDGDATINPNAVEICNGLDDDCDNVADAGHLGRDLVCVADTCLQILAAHPDADDGQYLIDFSDTGPDWTECDMGSFGGGWTQVFVDDMSPPDPGWSMTTTSECGIWGEILGGYGVISGPNFNAGGITQNTISTRSIPHNAVWVEFDYIALDSWDFSGQTGLGPDFGIAYFDSTQILNVDFNNHVSIYGEVCGWYRPNYPQGSYDSRLYVSTIQAGQYADFLLKIGSTLNQGPWDESFGVDDVYVWVR